jgi:type II secretion system protein N
MGKQDGIILAGVAYLLFTLAVGLFFLWYLFPDQSVKEWLENRATATQPELDLQIGSLSLSPQFTLSLKQVSLLVEERALLELTTLTLHPLLRESIRERKVRLTYTGELPGGTTNGKILWQNGGQVQIDGEISGLDLAGLPGIRASLGRSLSGSLQGNYSYVGDITDQFKAQKQLACTLSQGTVSLKEPVLGMEQVNFEKVVVDCQGDEILTCSGGEVKSPDFDATFEGQVILNQKLIYSQLQFKGNMQPGDTLLDEITGKGGGGLLRLKVEDGRLPFIITGDLAAPGIEFSARSIRVFDTMHKKRQ